MSKGKKLTGRVSYRLEGEELGRIKALAASKNISPDEWCRQAAREKLAVMRPKVEPEKHESLASFARQSGKLGQFMKGEEAVQREFLEQRQPVKPVPPAPPASPAQPTLAQSLGPIMNQNQAIFEEVLRLKFLVRQLALRHIEGQLNGRAWEMIDQGSEGNMFREVAAKWCQRYGLKIKY